MSIAIREITTNRGLRRFISFPFRLYKNHPYWVPPLRLEEYNTLHWKRNPAFEHSEARYWLAYKDGRPAGRIAGFLVRPYIDKWKNRYLRFGYIEFIDDEEVSRALLGTVEALAKELGMTAVNGPMGFTDLDPEGLLIDGFEELGTLATIYNHPYYPEHLEKLDYVKDMGSVEYELPVPDEPNEKIARIAEIVMRRNKLTKLEATRKRDVIPYAKELFRLIDEGYAHLYGVVPLTSAQEDMYIKMYLGFIRPEFVPVVLDEDGKMVAFGITMPSLSRALQKNKGRLFPFGFIHLLKAMRKNERADLYLVAIKKEYQGKGVNAILIHEMSKVYKKLGIKWVESNPELDTNRQVQTMWKHYERRQHKRRTFYIKHLK